MVNFILNYFLDDALLCIRKMLRYQKIDVSEGIDVNKTSASKECELCHYWFY